MHSPWNPIIRLTLALSAAAALLSMCPAQEVASVDLTKVEARVGLRRPQAAATTPDRYSGSRYITHCPDSAQKSGALDTSLVSLDRTHYEIGDELRFEVMLENIGSVPIRIPSSPNLADLQPSDPAKQFAYYELQIAVSIAAGDRWSSNTGGYAVLYGNDDHENTMLTLEPGQWIRVTANGKIRLDDELRKLTRQGSVADRAYAESALFRNETLLTARLSATAAREVCIAETHGRSVSIQVSAP